MGAVISRRLKAARERAGLTQGELSGKLGFKDRQTLAAIESGQRKMTAEELLRAVSLLDVSLEYFTDPFRLDGEGRFSWRMQKGTARQSLDEFEARAGRWIALYRELADDERPTDPLQARLPLTKASTYEAARAVAERLGAAWELGDIPALRLAQCVRERLGALIIHVDAPKFISGAACHLAEMNAILINRNEPEGRRHYDLAHETFHLLTWEQMPPEHEEGDIPRTGKSNRIEQLADNFASALLMPERSLTAHWQNRGDDIVEWLNKTSSAFHVSAPALKWRLVQLEWISKAEALQIKDDRLTSNGGLTTSETPPLFSREFMERIQKAIAAGNLSVRRAATLLDTTIEDLAETFKAHQLPD